VTATVVILVVAAVLIVAAAVLIARRERPARRGRLQELIEAVDPDGPPEEVRAELTSAVARLPEPEKLVVSLTYYEDMRDDDIAGVIGVEPTTVGQLREQGLRRLRATYHRRPQAG
jgi:DNA-directed RNA polymerase specialized sigma24 family protein